MFKLGATPLSFSHPIKEGAWWRARERGYLWLILPFNVSGYKYGVILREDGSGMFGKDKFAQIYYDRNCPSYRILYNLAR